jgi:hypothetical protein
VPIAWIAVPQADVDGEFATNFELHLKIPTFAADAS